MGKYMIIKKRNYYTSKKMLCPNNFPFWHDLIFSRSRKKAVSGISPDMFDSAKNILN